MKKKLLNSMRVLLVAAGLCAGASAWADETILLPTGGVTTISKSSSDAAYSAEATSWKINQGVNKSGDRIFTSNGPYLYVKFDASAIEGTITEATLSFDIASAAYNTSYDVFLIGAADWDATTATYSTLSDGAKTGTNIANDKWSTKNVASTINYDITSKVTKSLMGLGICCSTAREQTISNIKLTIKHTTATLYTATFSETASLSPAITIYTDEDRTITINNGNLLDNTTYYYTATLTGYEDYNGSFAVSGTNPSVSFTMISKSAYTINAVCSGATVSIASGYASVGTTYSAYVSKYVQYNGKYYVLDDESNTDLSGYLASYTMGDGGAEVKNINYTLAETVSFFNEWENATQSISNSGYYTSYNSSTVSGGYAKAVQGNANRDLHQAFTISVKGNYTIEMPYYNSNASARKYVLYLDGTDEANKLDAKSVNGNTGGTFSQTVELTAGSHTIYLKEDGATLTPCFDYLLVSLVSLPATVTSAGWATLYTPYALDFSSLSEDLTAYTATCTESTVTLTKVSTVPAGTGVVLKGAAKNYDIPVIASSETDKGHLLGSATEATAYNAYDGYTLYMLKMVNEKAQFVPMTSGSLAAGKAYLKIASGNSSLARSLNVVFADETTGIQTVQGEGVAVNGYYNLSGQRVNQPTKGLYIVNGKKIIVK